MNVETRCIPIAALIGAAAILSGGRASPASYSDSFTADPTTFTCGYYGSVEICGGYTGLSSTRYMNAGDSATEAVEYTSPFVVPGSKTSNVAYISLIDSTIVPGPALPGPNYAITNSTISGYSGPALYPYTGPYEGGFLGGYVAIVGYGSAYGAPNSGFSLTGMTSDFDIVTSDPNPIIGVAYGFQAILPATPELLSSFPGGTLGSPVILPAGLIGKVSSDISGPAPDSQFYTFIWNGGLLQTEGTITDPNPLADFDFQLFKVVDGTRTELEDLALSSSDDFSALMSVDLAKGDYEIGMFTDSPYDPQFTITFDTPVGSYVPEPPIWSLMIGGFLALGGALRTKRQGSGRSRLKLLSEPPR